MTEKKLSEILPKTREELQAWAAEWDKRTKNYGKCESPIETDFLHCFYKVMAEDVSIEGQVPCQTCAGSFRLDFVITQGNRKIAVECDGKEFHDKQRDEAILESGFVDSIYRVPGRSLYYFTNDVLDLLRNEEPSLFNARGNELLDGMLDDGSERDTRREKNSLHRALRERKLAEDGECELGEIEYKAPQYILLSWRRSPEKKMNSARMARI